MRMLAIVAMVALLAGCAEQAEKGPPVPPRYTITSEDVSGGEWYKLLTLRDSKTGEEWRVLYSGNSEGKAMAFLSGPKARP